MRIPFVSHNEHWTAHGNYAFSGIGHCWTFQISAVYSAIVRSLENVPEPARFKMAVRAHWLGSAYNEQSRSSASM